MTEKTSIRQIETKDIPLLFDYGKEFFNKAQMPGEWNEAEFLKNWTFLLDKGIGGILGAFLGAKIIGALGSVLSGELCTGAPYATEVFLYVGEGYRHGIGTKLIREFERWSTEAGAKRIHLTDRIAMGLETGKLFHRLGYAPAEAVWVKDLTKNEVEPVS